MSTGFYTRGWYRIGRGELPLHSTTNLKWLLLRSTSTYSFNPDHDFVADIFSNGGVEITVPSYVRQAVTGNTWTLDDANNRVMFDSNDINFGALEAGQTVKAFVLFEQVTNDADSPVIFHCDGLVQMTTLAPIAAPLTYAITGATQANPVTISSAGHTFTNGMKVKITGVVGMTQLNNNVYTVAGAVAGVSYQLSGINGTGYSAYVSGGSAKQVVTAYVFNRDAVVDAAALNFGGVTGTLLGNWPVGNQAVEIMDLSGSVAQGVSSEVQSQVLLPAPLGGGQFNINFNAAGFFYLLGGL